MKNLNEEKILEPEILDNIQSFSGAPEEMSTGEKFLSKGKALQRTQTAYTTAIAVQKPRSITKVAHNVLEEAKLAGASFYYGWTIKTKNGPVKIERPSIDLAMCAARNYGNCVIDVEGTETLTHYMLKGIFIDLESGFTCPRLFRQRKRQSLGGKMEKDLDRQEDIVFQIGQSKAIRNAIIRAMPEWLINQAIETAKGAERSKIENINLAREKVIAFFEPYEINVDRIESKIGRTADQWTPDDIVDLRGMATALKERRITADELFPKPEESIQNQNIGQELPPNSNDEEIIAQFKNCSKKGVLDWEAKNREMIHLMRKSVQEAFLDKWNRTFGEPYNGDPPSKGKKIDQIMCPDKGVSPLSDCEECKRKDSCDVYKKESPEDPGEFDQQIFSKYLDILGLPTINRIARIAPFHCKNLNEIPENQRDDFIKALEREVDKQNQ